MYAFQNEYCYVVNGVAKTNTRIIAEKSGREHKAILKNFNPESRDGKPFLVEFLQQGEITPVRFNAPTNNGGSTESYYYEFTEEQALTVLPFIAGAEAFRVQREIVPAFIQTRQFIEEIANGEHNDPIKLMQRANSLLMERDRKKTLEQETVTQLAEKASVKLDRPIRAQEMNHILISRGFQTEDRIMYNGKEILVYKLTPRGEAFGCYVGSSVNHKAIRWIDTVLDFI